MVFNQSVKQTQAVILGSMTVAVINAAVTSLTTPATAKPMSLPRIVIGGWIITTALLLGSDVQPEISEGFAVLILFGSLFGPNGTVLADIAGRVTGPNGQFQPVRGSSSNLDSGQATGPSQSGSGSRPSVATLTPLDLVTMPNGFKLNRQAAASFAKVEQTYGHQIGVTNTYRTNAQQTAAYEKVGPNGTFAPPGKSLHELGLAVDVNPVTVDLNDANLYNAFISNGWFRAGKVMPQYVNGQLVRTNELWHYSYGRPG